MSEGRETTFNEIIRKRTDKSAVIIKIRSEIKKRLSELICKFLQKTRVVRGSETEISTFRLSDLQ